MIQISTRKIDQQRAARMLLAVLADNQPAIQPVIDEAIDDVHGANGLLFALLALAAELAVVASPDDAVDQVERALLALDETDG